MARKTKAEKAHEAHVHKLVGRALVGNPINVFDISKVFKEAEALIAKGGDEQSIADNLQTFAQSLAAKVA